MARRTALCMVLLLLALSACNTMGARIRRDDFDVKRRVPFGPAPGNSPPARELVVIDHLVPSGPNQEESPLPPAASSLDDFDVKRRVPFGPPPGNSPPAIDRLVPGGPNREEPPPTPDASNRDEFDIKRRVPFGPAPGNSPPADFVIVPELAVEDLVIDRLVPGGPNREEPPPTPDAH